MRNPYMPPPEITRKRGKEAEERFALPSEYTDKCDKEFLQYLLSNIKNNPVLSKFHSRLIYECRVVEKVIELIKENELRELEGIIEDLSEAKNLQTIACHDNIFHARLFTIAEEMDFYTWWHLEAKDMQGFIESMWKSIGYKTDDYKRLVDQHENIFQAIKDKNSSAAREAMEKHFSIVLFHLVGVMYNASPKPKKTAGKN